VARWLGIDLGGTNLKLALVERDAAGALAVVHRHQQPVDTSRGPAPVMADLIAAGVAACDRWGSVDGAGVGVPGLFDADAGTIEFFPNLPGPWRGTAVTGPVSDALGAPAVIINDARAFTLAESRLGAAAGCDTVAAYVLGTGIGGGIVVGGRLHVGRHGRGGELGHVIVVPGGPPCGCGNAGCLEAVAASGAIAARGGQADVAATFAAAAAGDGRAVAAIAAMVDALGRAIAGMITVLVPERVVVGGGVAEAGAALFDPLRTAVDRHVTLVDHGWYEVVPASLGPHAGAIGAALWAAEHTEVSSSEA
jgi:glucokinase